MGVLVRFFYFPIILGVLLLGEIEILIYSVNLGAAGAIRN